MRKFFIHSIKGIISILEVECKIVTALEDPSVMWNLQSNEYKVKILKPEILLDKYGKTVTFPVYYSHALFNSAEEALSLAKNSLFFSMERDYAKHEKELTQEILDQELSKIEVKML